MRTLTLTYADLGQLYQAEENLNALSDMLQRLELKHAAQLDALRSMMQNAAVRLENSENTGVSLPGNAVGPRNSTSQNRQSVVKGLCGSARAVAE